jgi:CheY-like chemotaxis protein
VIAHLTTILLVEDNPRDAELTMTALAEHNLANHVTLVRDGAEALDFMYRRGAFAGRPNGHPILVLLDLKLPIVDGLVVLRQIKSDAQMRLIPVVILTSSAEECDLVKSYQLGVNAYVVKPVNFHEFVDAVRELGMFWGLINKYPPGAKSIET